jgi:hypothetical protein
MTLRGEECHPVEVDQLSEDVEEDASLSAD